MLAGGRITLSGQPGRGSGRQVGSAAALRGAAAEGPQHGRRPPGHGGAVPQGRAEGTTRIPPGARCWNWIPTMPKRVAAWVTARWTANGSGPTSGSRTGVRALQRRLAAGPGGGSRLASRRQVIEEKEWRKRLQGLEKLRRPRPQRRGRGPDPTARRSTARWPSPACPKCWPTRTSRTAQAAVHRCARQVQLRRPPSPRCSNAS